MKDNLTKKEIRSNVIEKEIERNPQLSKKNIAVVMGGYTEENLESMKSGQIIYDSLDKNLYNVYKVKILKEGWFFVDDRGEKMEMDKTDFGVSLRSGYKVKFDVCFNIIHGSPGENGILQAYWDAVGQKYTGINFYQSAQIFNKKDTLSLLSKYGILSAKSMSLRKGETISEEEVVENLGLPVFVKPNQSGSSIGITKVNDIKDLQKAVKFAFAEDDEILIESFLDGTEISVGILDFKGKTMVIGITEIVSDNEFFDYDAKCKGAFKQFTPARLDEKTLQVIEKTAVKAYNSLGLSGLVSAEFIVVNKIPYMLEMNTKPNFSPASILSQQTKHHGIALADFCGHEVEKACAKAL